MAEVGQCRHLVIREGLGTGLVETRHFKNNYLFGATLYNWDFLSSLGNSWNRKLSLREGRLKMWI